jgi:hypothetical protein
VAKSPKYLVDGVRDGNYVRLWKEGREWVVQVWKGKKEPKGDPDGDWAMPGVLPAEAALGQAILQT